MRNIFLLLLLFAGCSEDVKNCCQTCFKMTISDSIPIQFWLNGQETFNEKQICGVYQACFCQPFQCDDEITIQFVGKTDGIANLIIYDSTNQEITTLPFEEISEGVYQLSFTPSEQSICEKIKFVIDFDEYTNLLTNSVFNTSLGWTNSSLGLSDWSVVSGEARVVLGSFISSELYYQSHSGVAGTYRVRLKGRITESGGTDSSVVIYAEFLSGGIGGITVKLQLVCNLFTSPDNTFDGFVVFSVPSSFDTIAISAAQGGPSSATATVFVDHFYAEIQENITATSDCIDLQQSHECTELITYTNTKDFDGIDYESSSPPPVFNIRIPAQFWKRNNPMTQEDSVLSNGVIVTRRASKEKKTLLEIGFVPNWLHDKIQNILMHNSVQMLDDKGVLTYWKKRDDYENENLNRYPLSKASVWLTKYNSVEKNTI